MCILTSYDMTINSVVKDCLVEIKKPTLVIAAVSVVFP